MKREDGFKVVRQEGAMFFSARAETGTIGGTKTRYFKTVDTVAPKGAGPLAVFERRGDADAFWRHNNAWQLRVLRCRYVPSRKRLLHAVGQDWTGMFLEDAPAGTRFATRVRLCL